MQWGPRVVWGRGCPLTLSGAHIVEFNETGSEATCCQCALVIEGADLRDAFMMLPINARRDLMAEAVRRAIDGREIEVFIGGID